MSDKADRIRELFPRPPTEGAESRRRYKYLMEYADLLDGIDGEALKRWKAEMDRLNIHTGVPYRTVVAVLAAIDQEETP